MARARVIGVTSSHSPPSPSPGMPSGKRPGMPASGANLSPQAVLETVRELAAELHPQSTRIRALGSGHSLERDFGLDSLARVELAARLERQFRLNLPEAAVTEADTPMGLFAAIQACPQSRADTARSGAAWPARAAPTPSGGEGNGGPMTRPAGDASARAPIERAAAALAMARPARAESELPQAITTVLGALEWHAAVHPERVTLVLHEPGEPLVLISYGALRRRALGAAHGLVHQCQVKPGERVAIMLPTGIDFFAAFYGALYAGAVPVPIYPPTRASQLEDHLRRIAGIVANAGAAVLVTVPQARAMTLLLRPLAPALRQIMSPAMLRDQPGLATEPRCRAGDTAFVQYTSGSTGQPKGVVLTHGNLMANLRSMREASNTSSADLFVSWLPLYHDMGLIGAGLGSMVFGYKLVLTSPYTFLSRPVRWLQLLARHRATISAGPNFAYELCLSKITDDDLRELDLSSVRLLFNGAEAVSPDTVVRFAERFAGCGLSRTAITPVYGLAECSLGLSFPPLGRGPRIDTIDREALHTRGEAVPARPNAAAPIRLVASGRALPRHAVRIVAAPADSDREPPAVRQRDRAAGTGDALPERQQGEIEFRGPSASSGYFGNPDATFALLHDDWRRTGDLGYIADGELFVTGRIKDIIIRGGHNIHPQELEEAAARVPGVRKGGVAVFAARDAALGTERLIVLAETLEHDLAERERIVTAIGHLAVDLLGLPADAVVLAPPHAILKTSSGKIRRAACRERFERGELLSAAGAPWQQMLRLAAEGAALRLARAAARLGKRVWGIWAVASAVLLTPPLIAVLLLARDPTHRRRLAAASTRGLFRTWGCPVSVSGDAARIAQLPCLVVTNHASYLDGLVLSAALPPAIAFVAKQELAHQRIAGSVLRALGAVFVERFDARRSAQDAHRITAALARHERLVIFAEGTFHAEPGLLPLHLGAFLSAVTQAVAIVPVAIVGTREMLPGEAWLPRPARLRVIVGDPIRPPRVPSKRRTGASAAQRSSDVWMAAIALRAQVRAWLLTQTGEPDLDA
jgi:1-acyl-sn-glycerol-3-phosphate acyltransferase